MVTSYCPDGLAATELVLGANLPVRCFYDLDTPVTLARLEAGETVGYIGPDGLAGFDLVLSYTGGGALDALRTRLGARRTAPIYGSVDPATAPPRPAAPAIPGAALLPRHLCRGPAGDARAPVRRAGPPAAGRALRHRRRAVSGRVSLDRQHLLRPPPAAAGAPGLLLLLAPDAERDPRGDGAHGLVPLRPPVRGRRLRRADPVRLVRRPRQLLRRRATRSWSPHTTEDAHGTRSACPTAELAAIARRARERTLDEHTAARRAAEMIAAFERPLPARRFDARRRELAARP